MRAKSISPVAKIILLFIGFVLTAFILGGFVFNGLLRMSPQNANVIVILVIVLITWKAYKSEGKNLSELGLDLNWKHLRLAIFGLLLGGVFIVPLVYLIAFVKGYPVIFSQNFEPAYVLTGLWLVLPTVVIEELVFRGICFKKAVGLYGVVTANVVFALIFILSHWINLGAFGNPTQMTVLLITGLGHVLYATAFLKSKSLYFPMGIHLGNNWVTYFVFSNMDPTLQDQHTLINVVTDGAAPVWNGEFIMTTLLTAAMFLLFALVIQKYVSFPKAITN